MVTTPHLGLTLVEQSQAQKEVTVNMALMRIDAVLNSAAISRALSTPPTEPQEGDVYIVGAVATDSWAGKEGQIAYFEQVWRFIAPNDGMMLWVQDEAAHVVFTGGVWAATGGGGGGEVNTGQNAAGDAGGVFKQKTAASLIFNNIVAGSNVTVSGGGASGGDIVISATGGGGGGSGTLEGLSDVAVASPTDGEILQFDTSSGNWLGRSIAAAGIAAAGHGHVLADIADAGVLAAKSSVGDADWSGAALSVAHGGTGRSSVTTNAVLRGNGAGALAETGVRIDAADCIYGYRSKVRVETGGAYTLQADDSGCIIETADAGGVILTLQEDMPQGLTAPVMQGGAGAVTFSPAGGASLLNRNSHNRTAGQYAVCTVYVRSNADGESAVYVMTGDSA